jgi:two-component system, chemotaxis family, sensor kinase CheA
VRFAHQFETTLDEMRSGRLAPTETVLKIYLRAADHLADLVSSARDNVQMPPGSSSELIEKLTQLVSGGASAPVVDHAEPEEEVEYTFKPLAFSFDFGPTEPVEAEYTIRFSATRTLFANGNDPVHLFRTLGQLGRVSVHIDTSALVPFDILDWAESYFFLGIDASHDRDPRCDCGGIRIRRRMLHPRDRRETPGQDPARSAECSAGFSGRGSAAPASCEQDHACSATGQQRGGPRKVGKQRPEGTVRVDLDLVDRLINIVGELVINQAVLAQCVQDSGMTGLTDVAAGLDEFKNLAREIQENVMAIRAQSVKPLFQRMARIVREASDLAESPFGSKPSAKPPKSTRR